MAGELGRDWSLPLLPAGATIFESLPFAALVLDALAPAVGDGLITMRDDPREGVLVVRDGIISDCLWVVDGARTVGDEAFALMRAAVASSVSACRLSDEAMAVVGPLIRGEPCYADLRLEWVVWPRLLDDLLQRSATYVVELATPGGRGVTVIREGQQVATFAESHLALGDPDLVDNLSAQGVGAIRVLVDRGARASSQPGPLSAMAPAVITTSLYGPRREQVPQAATRPAVMQDDDPNTTLSTLFGTNRDLPDRHLALDADPSGRRLPMPVDALLPELRLLVRNRLQRSSSSVEEIVDSAASDRQSVEWLADRVRVMTVRGFLHSTFDQLADDMLALAHRDTD